MNFSDLTSVFELMEKTSQRTSLTMHMAKLYANASREDVGILTYLCQGILVPQSHGIQLGIGDKLAQHALRVVSGNSTREIESLYRKNGDLGITAQMLLSKKTQSTLLSENLTVKKVCDNFYKIATSFGEGSQDTKINLLGELLSNASPIEAKHIIRFVQGSLRLGVGEPTLLDSLSIYHVAKLISKSDEITADGNKIKIAHVSINYELQEKEKSSSGSVLEFSCLGKLGEIAAKKNQTIILPSISQNISFPLLSISEVKSRYSLKIDILEAKRLFRELFDRAFNMRSDLAFVAENVVDGKLSEIEKISPAVFSPIRPALAERLLTPEQIFEKLGKCSVEGKYDGFRLQVHKKGNEVRIFSRKEEPMTHMFPEIVQAVKNDFSAKEAIFEGEAIAMDEKDSRFLPFQVTIQRKRKHGIFEKSSEIPLRLFAFELLFADGVDYTKLPYEKRREKLISLIEKNSRTIRMASRILAKSSNDIQSFFEKCLSEGLEGIIAKDLNSPYVAGARKFAWIKLKKSYGKSVDTFDVVVIGYYLGKGKRTQFDFGGMLTAIYDPKKGTFKSIAKVGTGFSEEEMQSFAKMLEKISTKDKPQNIESDMEPDVWVTPKIVIEVNADEITKSPTHIAGREATGEGLALRFPRMISIRTDKDPKDATTESEILELFELQSQK
ncbi:ATP-dependent DNA ligase [Candidatus Micrarchaeota archaeon]|nr:ATP-dependent DNA ligase [Candidatus Micrarchaeota archaeon]